MDVNQQLEELKQKEVYLEVINSFAVILVGSQSIDEVVWGVAKNVISRLNYLDCIIYLYDEKLEKLVQRAAYGPKNKNYEEINSPIVITPGKGIVGAVFQTGVGEIISDTSKDPRYIIDDEIRLSEITVPLSFGGKIV